jgi:hypothetical protein
VVRGEGEIPTDFLSQNGTEKNIIFRKYKGGILEILCGHI